MKHLICLICNNKHPEIYSSTSRKEGLGAQRDRKKAICILSKLFYLPSDVQDDLSGASYCVNCTVKLCQLEEVYDQIELCQANIVQSRRDIEMSLIKASFMDQNCHDQKGQDNVRTTRGNGQNGTNHYHTTRKLLCDLIHYKAQNVAESVDLEDSDDGTLPGNTTFNENSSDETAQNDEIGHNESGSGQQSTTTTDLDEDIVENVESCPSTTTTTRTADIIDKGTTTSIQDDDEEWPFLELCSFSASANTRKDSSDQHREEVDDGNGSPPPPLLEKYGLGEELKKEKDENIRSLKRQCVSRKCLIVLKKLKLQLPVQNNNNEKLTTPTVDLQKGPSQDRRKANFSSPMNPAISVNSSLMVSDSDGSNPSSIQIQQKETEKGILTFADKTTVTEIAQRNRILENSGNVSENIREKESSNSINDNSNINKNTFRCPYTECQTEVVGKEDLIVHLKYHMSLPDNSNDTQDSKFRCPYMTCEVLSENKPTLISHLKAHMEAD